jgi:hypothetical protein
VLEKMDVEKLQRLASEVSPEALSLVKARAAWPEPAKTTLVTSGASCSAKWMNKWGVSSEYSDELCIAAALSSIVAGHVGIKSELQKLLAEKKAQTKATTNEKVL